MALIFTCRLRTVKMEQRKLTDQANTVADLAKVCTHYLLFFKMIHELKEKYISPCSFKYDFCIVHSVAFTMQIFACALWLKKAI